VRLHTVNLRRVGDYMTTLKSIWDGVFVIGIGATLLTDLWSALLRHLGVATLNYAMLGRWCMHWKSGIWFHESIRDAASAPGEKLVGWILHYLTGVFFAMLFVYMAEPRWIAVPTLGPALVFGGVTVLVPWLVLQPALGAGLASANTPHPWRSRATGLATHLVFGSGLYLCAKALTFF